MTLKKQEKRCHCRGKENSGRNSETTSERNRTVVNFPVPGIIQQTKAQAELFPQRKACKRDDKSAEDSEQINIEGEHGALDELHQLHELNRMNTRLGAQQMLVELIQLLNHLFDGKFIFYKLLTAPAQAVAQCWIAGEFEQ